MTYTIHIRTKTQINGSSAIIHNCCVYEPQLNNATEIVEHEK